MSKGKSAKQQTEQKKPPYDILLSESTLKDLIDYKNELIEKPELAGVRLKENLNDQNFKTMSTEEFLEALLATKKPQIFAESEIEGGGKDWSHKELKILGSVNVAANVEIFDNGVWSSQDKNFKVHDKPFNGNLLFTPGILLKGKAGPEENPIDYDEVVKKDENGQAIIDQEKYNALVEKRMLPLLAHADEAAAKEGKLAVITMPGIGTSAFAGEEFKGKMGKHLDLAMQAMLQKYVEKFPNIECVYYDPHNECENKKQNIGKLKYRVRPYLKTPPYQSQKSQLLPPNEYEEEKGEFKKCVLFKIVAWDHASLPGNDYYIESRHTDDGVSAAATNLTQVITGIEGVYNEKLGMYLPPPPNENWKQVVEKNNIHLLANNNVKITLENGKIFSLNDYERLQNAQKSSIAVPDQEKKEELLQQANEKLKNSENISPQRKQPKGNNVKDETIPVLQASEASNNKKSPIMDSNFWVKPEEKKEEQQKINEVQENHIDSEEAKVLKRLQEDGVAKEYIEAVEKFLINGGTAEALKKEDSKLPLKDKIYKLVGKNIPFLKNYCDKKLDEHAEQRRRVTNLRKSFGPQKAYQTSIHPPDSPVKKTSPTAASKRDAGKSFRG